VLYVVIAIVGAFALVTLILVLVFSAVRKAIDGAAESLAPEGVELDSGRLNVTMRMRDFRTPTFYSGGGIKVVPGRVVLTKQRLHILTRPQRYGIIERADLGAFTVGILDGRLHLQATDPRGATGSIDYRIPVRDPSVWVAALTGAGAKAA
jgi:hypothetical protein